MQYFSFRLLSFGVTLLFLVSCFNNTGSNSGPIYTEESEFSIPQDWHCFDVQYDIVCCPNKWQPKNQTEVLFFTEIDDLDEHKFFVILRFDEEINKMAIEDYVREVYVQLKNDTVELFKEYHYCPTKNFKRVS